MAGRRSGEQPHISAEQAIARQWSRAALAFAALFASLPIATRLVTGSWSSPGAAELACICLLLAAYLHVMYRKTAVVAPDPASFLAEAVQLASDGRIEEAIERLTKVMRLSPQCWQAYEYRAVLKVTQGDPTGAIQDVEQAIRLAPKEAHLHELRAGICRVLEEARAPAGDNGK
jgi:Flp pilus assembly protein TadD